MRTSLRNKVLFGILAAGLVLALPGEARALIGGLSVDISSTSRRLFRVGVATNTTGTGQLIINVTSGVPANGEKITLTLVDSNGNAIAGGISPSSFTTTAGVTRYGDPTQGNVPITFFVATGRRLLASHTQAGGSSFSATSSTFTVLTNSPKNLVIIGPCMNRTSGLNTSTGRTGSACSPNPYESFAVSVFLTDAYFNAVTNSHDVSFTVDGDRLTFPSSGLLSNGSGGFAGVFMDKNLTRTITVTDVTDPGGVASQQLTLVSAGPAVNELFPFPSPFNPKKGQTMTFRFRMDQPDNVKIKILDQFGQEVYEKDAAAAGGLNNITWDGKNGQNVTVAPGVYIVLFEIGDSIKSKKRIGVSR